MKKNVKNEKMIKKTIDDMLYTDMRNLQFHSKNNVVIVLSRLFDMIYCMNKNLRIKKHTAVLYKIYIEMENVFNSQWD